MKPLERILGQEILSSTPVSGGCIANSQRINTASGNYFCKISSSSIPLFLEEAAGLEALRQLEAIRIPKVIHSDDHHLVLEWIETQSPRNGFWKNFGRQLAAMHARPQTEFGFSMDNHIGTTPQANPQRSPKEISWAEYFLEHRLKPLLSHKALSVDSLLQVQFQKATGRIHEVLSVVTEPPSLVHGDLWSGNFICDQDNQPVLIDPAPYRGHREVDLAMSELFGGFAPEFYSAYQAEFPLIPGYESRRPIYNLYHLLNHWIIFGAGSYRDRVLSLL